MLVRHEVHDHVATLTLDRPERRNALSGALIEALVDALMRAGADPDVAVIVLTGAGDKAFCAGGDLAGGFSRPGALEAARHRARFSAMLQAVHRCGPPVIARLGGDALGGGFGLAMACDMVVARTGIRLGTPEIRLGLFPMVIMAELRHTVPRKLLAELMYSGRYLTPEEALGHGLVNAVVPPDALDDAVAALAGPIATRSPAILRLGKQAFHGMEDLPQDAALAYLQGMLELNLKAEDAAEGVTAFLQKRDPTWKGR